MKIQDLKKSFITGDVEKQEYIKTAYAHFHQLLFNYSETLEHTDIKEISIDSEGVVFTIRSTGIKIRCQPGDHRSPPVETFNFADFEPNESRMMTKLFEGCNTFYDIGANIGWHSLNLSAKYRGSTFYCFEPIPITYHHLLSNIKLNAFNNIITFNLALSDNHSQKNYYFYEACSGNASAVDLTERPDVSTIVCTQTKLDDFYQAQELAPPDFIKCDVEGAELLVFRGAVETIKVHKPIVMAEILRKWSAKYDYNPNEIFTLFFGMGYLAFTTDGYYITPFHEMTEKTIETNFFFLHNAKHEQIIKRFLA
jgi:FkbM family methyltransferase